MDRNHVLSNESRLRLELSNQLFRISALLTSFSEVNEHILQWDEADTLALSITYLERLSDWLKNNPHWTDDDE